LLGVLETVPSTRILSHFLSHKEKEEDMWLITGLILGVVIGAWIKDRKSWLDFLDTAFDKIPF
tara:strand:+ start:806 stop:994 length:189 start_codon:yes stop_codon:yes gene_type:complete